MVEITEYIFTSETPSKPGLSAISFPFFPQNINYFRCFACVNPDFADFIDCACNPSPGKTAHRPITVEPVYTHVKNAIYHTRDVSIDVKGQSHWWNVSVNAVDENFAQKNDYVTGCSFDPFSHRLTIRQIR